MHFCHFREFRSVIQAKNYPKTPKIFPNPHRGLRPRTPKNWRLKFKLRANKVLLQAVQGSVGEVVKKADVVEDGALVIDAENYNRTIVSYMQPLC